MPPGFDVTKGWNIRSRTSGLMPGPVSQTSTAIRLSGWGSVSLVGLVLEMMSGSRVLEMMSSLPVAKEPPG